MRIELHAIADYAVAKARRIIDEGVDEEEIVRRLQSE